MLTRIVEAVYGNSTMIDGPSAARALRNVPCSAMVFNDNSTKLRVTSAIALVLLLGTYHPAEAKTVIQPIFAGCSSSGQLCEPPVTFAIETGGQDIVTLEYITPASHCSDIGVNFSIDSVPVGSTSALPPRSSEGGINGPIQTGGTHTVSAQAMGVVGGCNVGALGSWAGTVRVVLSEKDSGESCTIGNPCNPSNGNKYQREPDYESPRTGLSFVRHYNSQQTLDQGLGVGWSSNFHKEIEVVDATAIKVRRADGRAEPFFCDGTDCTGHADSNLIVTQQGTAFVLTLPDGREEHYDSSGLLTQEVDNFGKFSAYTYDVNGNLQSATGPFGHQLTFTYQDGRLQTMTDPAGQPYTYTYLNDTLASVTYPDSSFRSYSYLHPIYPHQLTTITDEEGNVFATFSYDSQGRALSTEHAVTDNGSPQERFTLQYNSGTQTIVTDAKGTAESWVFEEHLNVKYPISRINQIDLKGIVQEFDDQGNLTSRTDEEGRVTKHTYNATNQRISSTEAFGTAEQRISTFEYLSPDVDLVTNVASPSVFTSAQKNTIAVYGSSNEVLSITEQGFQPDGTPVSRTTGFTYFDPVIDGVQFIAGKRKIIDGPRVGVNDTTTLEYFDCDTGAECGQVAAVVNALSHEITFDSYDAHGRVTQTTNSNGLITTLQYDLRGRMVAATEKLSLSDPGRTTSFDYLATGLLKSTTTPEGVVVTRTYDAAHDLKRIEDNLGHFITFKYDLNGERVEENTFDPQGVLVRSLNFDYDIRNRLAETRSPHLVVGGTITAESITDIVNDATGNVVAITDPNGNVTSSTYDALNRATLSIEGFGSAAEAANKVAYDVNDRPISIARGSVVGGTFQTLVETTFAYDDLGNQLREGSPDRGAIILSYDEVGNPTVRMDARGIISALHYDALSRLELIAYPEPSKNIGFEYDAGPNGVGRLTRMTDESGSTDFVYDGFGNLASEIRTIDGVSYATGYTYDGDDRLTDIVYPSGTRVTHSRDTIGRIVSTSVTIDGVTQTLASSVTYLPFGRASGFEFGNGVPLLRNFDQAYRLTGQTAGTVQDLTIALDPGSNITSIADNLDASRDQGFVYDALDRLTQGDGIYGVRDYAYDENGNRLSLISSAGTDAYNYDVGTNRLGTVAGPNATSFGYDASGNTVAKGPRTFTYDDTNRMTEALASGVLVGEYVYNGKGERVKKTAGGATTVFHYDAQGQLIAESDALGNAQREYVYFQGQPLALITRSPGGPAELIIDDQDAGFSATTLWEPGNNGTGDINGAHQRHRSNAPAPGGIVVDDSAATRVGPWAQESRPSSNYLGTHHRAEAGSGEALATWTADIPVAGQYTVYARWKLASDMATNAPYTVHHTGGSDTVLVNQKNNGGTWNALGTYSFAAGPTTISLSNDANGAVSADAIYLVDSAATGDNIATWSLQVATAGDYDLYVRWPEGTKKAAKFARYTVVHANGSDTFTRNQRDNTAQWNLLGTFTLTPGAGHRLELSDQSNGKWVLADAVRLVGTAPSTAITSTFYYHNDHLGTPQRMTDAGASIVWSADYAPFGDVLETVNTVTNNLRFPGQYFDAETGLHYNYFRDYDSSTGRYFSSDPIGLLGGINTYAYVSANPLKFIDPTGQQRGIKLPPAIKQNIPSGQTSKSILDTVAKERLMEELEINETVAEELINQNFRLIDPGPPLPQGVGAPGFDRALEFFQRGPRRADELVRQDRLNKQRERALAKQRRDRAIRAFCPR